MYALTWNLFKSVKAEPRYGDRVVTLVFDFTKGLSPGSVPDQVMGDLHIVIADPERGIYYGERDVRINLIYPSYEKLKHYEVVVPLDKPISSRHIQVTIDFREYNRRYVTGFNVQGLPSVSVVKPSEAIEGIERVDGLVQGSEALDVYLRLKTLKPGTRVEGSVTISVRDKNREIGRIVAPIDLVYSPGSNIVKVLVPLSEPLKSSYITIRVYDERGLPIASRSFIVPRRIFGEVEESPPGAVSSFTVNGRQLPLSDVRHLIIFDEIYVRASDIDNLTVIDFTLVKGKYRDSHVRGLAEVVAKLVRDGEVIASGKTSIHIDASNPSWHYYGRVVVNRKAREGDKILLEVRDALGNKVIDSVEIVYTDKTRRFKRESESEETKSSSTEEKSGESTATEESTETTTSGALRFSVPVSLPLTVKSSIDIPSWRIPYDFGIKSAEIFYLL